MARLQTGAMPTQDRLDPSAMLHRLRDMMQDG